MLRFLYDLIDNIVHYFLIVVDNREIRLCFQTLKIGTPNKRNCTLHQDESHPPGGVFHEIRTGVFGRNFNTNPILFYGRGLKFFHPPRGTNP